MRIRSVLAGFVAAVAGTLGLVVGTGSPAAAETPLGNCYADTSPAHRDSAPWHAPGHTQSSWFTPLGLRTGDALRATASGRIRIDHWGATKDIAGELPVAGSGWPAPGLRRYMLIGKVTIGSVWLRDTGHTYGPGEWFPVGADSGCMLYHGAGRSGGRLVFSFNDDNLGDNGGSAAIVVKQWI